MKSKVVFIGFLYFFSINASGQISGSNLTESQLGRLPNDTSTIATIYARTLANFTHKSLKFSGTVEQFYSPRNGSSYLRLSQLAFQYRKNPLDIKVGNVHETIGRGSLVRSFEIPGAILEDLSYRSRHYFNRNILGLSAKYRWKGWNTSLLVGSPLNYVFPPTLGRAIRRTDKIAALYTDYNFKGQTVGMAAMKHQNPLANGFYFMSTASGSIGSAVSYYTEIAKNVSDFPLSKFSGDVPYVIYSGLNFSIGSFGMSAEFKKYNNFSIGAGINEPPALVKEHTSRVLNRSTHVLQPLNESGYQIEAFYTFKDFSSITFNNTLAINSLGQRTVFQEYYIAYDFTAKDLHDFKFFADFAQDPFKLQSNRISAGAAVDWKLTKEVAFSGNYEFQQFGRLGNNFQNNVLVGGLSFNKWVSSVILETSNDDFIVSKKSKIWLGLNFKYNLNRSNSLLLFAGERRGGPACNAGVCYEVLDFKGLELRMTNRF